MSFFSCFNSYYSNYYNYSRQFLKDNGWKLGKVLAFQVFGLTCNPILCKISIFARSRFGFCLKQCFSPLVARSVRKIMIPPGWGICKPTSIFAIALLKWIGINMSFQSARSLIGAPIAEEVVDRFFLQEFMLRQTPKKILTYFGRYTEKKANEMVNYSIFKITRVAISSLVFAIVHINHGIKKDPTGSLPFFIVGIILGGKIEMSKDLYGAIQAVAQTVMFHIGLNYSAARVTSR